MSENVNATAKYAHIQEKKHSNHILARTSTAKCSDLTDQEIIFQQSAFPQRVGCSCNSRSNKQIASFLQISSLISLCLIIEK